MWLPFSTKEIIPPLQFCASALFLLCISSLNAAASDLDWPVYIGIPTPPGIATFSHQRYTDETRYLYDYSDDTSGPIAYRIGPDGPYTHYINPDNPNSTDSSNPHGTYAIPRKTMPTSYGTTLAPGSVVEIHGALNGATTITVSGTEEAPIFIRGVSGQEPVHTSVGAFFIEGSYLVFENIKFDSNNGNKERFRIDRKDIVSGIPIHDIVIRNCEFYNAQATPTESYQIIRAKNDTDTTLISNIVVWNNYFHDMGTSRTEAVKNDVVGVSFDANAQYAWVIANRFDRVAGDGMQVAYDSYAAGVTTMPQHIYFAGNVVNDAFENVVDLKLASDIIISQNEGYNIGTGYGVIGGPTAIPYRYGSGEGPSGLTRSNIWTIYNTLHDSNISNGGFNSYVTGSAKLPESTYFIGNIAYNCTTSTNGGPAFYSGPSKDVYWINNAAWNVPGGFNVAADYSGSYTEDKTTIVNNIVGNISSNATNPNVLTLYGTPSSLGNRTTIKNNLFFDQAGATFRVSVFNPSPDHQTYSTYAAFCAAYTNFCVDSLYQSPYFNAAAEGDFTLQSSSPARDAGSSAEFLAAADAFEARYPTALSFRRYDFANNPRNVSNPIDIGPHDTNSQAPAAPLNLRKLN